MINPKRWVTVGLVVGIAATSVAPATAQDDELRGW